MLKIPRISPAIAIPRPPQFGSRALRSPTMEKITASTPVTNGTQPSVPQTSPTIAGTFPACRGGGGGMPPPIGIGGIGGGGGGVA
jgi:hypothetical protein